MLEIKIKDKLFYTNFNNDRIFRNFKNKNTAFRYFNLKEERLEKYNFKDFEVKKIDKVTKEHKLNDDLYISLISYVREPKYAKTCFEKIKALCWYYQIKFEIKLEENNEIKIFIDDNEIKFFNRYGYYYSEYKGKEIKMYAFTKDEIDYFELQNNLECFNELIPEKKRNANKNDLIEEIFFTKFRTDRMNIELDIRKKFNFPLIKVDEYKQRKFEEAEQEKEASLSSLKKVESTFMLRKKKVFEEVKKLGYPVKILTDSEILKLIKKYNDIKAEEKHSPEVKKSIENRYKEKINQIKWSFR